MAEILQISFLSDFYLPLPVNTINKLNKNDSIGLHV